MSTKPVKTFRVVLNASSFYVEDIQASSQQAAEDRMRELWDAADITADFCCEEITGIEAAELPVEIAPPVEQNRLKRFRVSFNDHRHYFYDVLAECSDDAIKRASEMAHNGDEGTDLVSDFLHLYGTEELPS